MNKKFANKEIIKEILPVNLTNDNKQTLKLIKRKLNIFNLKNETNYSLEDLGIKIIWDIYKNGNKNSIFYFYKELNEDFDYEKLDVYKENYHKTSKFLIDNIKGYKIYKKKEDPDSIFLFKKDKFILKQSFNIKFFELSNPLIWKIIQKRFDYSYNEISHLCNDILQTEFKLNDYVTIHSFYYENEELENAFKRGELIQV